MKRNICLSNLALCFCSVFLFSLFSFQSHAHAAPADYFDTVQKTYIGYYQRPADPAGLLYWADRLDKTGGNLNEIIEAFADSAEAQDLYGTINSSNISDVVDAVYLALFGREAENEGRNWYVNGFNAGRYTPATIMLNVLYGAQDNDLQSVNNKLAAANLFTNVIDPELDGYNFQVTYAEEADAKAGRAFLASVTWDPATVPTRDEVTTYMKADIADAGDPIFIEGMTLADLSGTWEVNAVSSPGPDWFRGPMTIDANGFFTADFIEFDGLIEQVSGIFSITSEGIVSPGGPGIPPSLRCTLDSGKSVMVCTYTSAEDENDATMMILTRKTASYSQGDLTGAWEINGMKSSFTWWERGPMTVDSNGSFFISAEEIDGSTITFSGTMTISSNGIITATGPGIPPTFRCSLDSDKSVAVCTFTSEAGHSDMMILTKKAASYSQGDLTGMWEANSLSSSYFSWDRGPMSIASNGSFSYTSTGSDGLTEPFSGKFSITPDGIITATEGTSPSFRCTMDSGKSVAACVYTSSHGLANMLVLTKKNGPGPAPNSGDGIPDGSGF